ncbi:MAG: PorT family protein [Bacteroidales bacterium]|nr:PorT family protein [Bacteroidales bacterium]
MKKSLLIMALLLVFGSSAFAIGGIDLGLKVGYKTNKLSYQKEDIKAGFANSFTIGAFGRVQLAGFYVQPEILWFKTQSVFDLSTNVDHDINIVGIKVPTGGKVDFTLNAMNFQVPVLVGYKFSLIDMLAVRAQAGPTMNFTIPQKTLINQSVGSSEPTEISNDTFDTKSIAFGFQAGVGFDIMSKITLDINYNFGISKVFGANIINNTEWGQYLDTNNISNAHNNMFMVTVGFKIL